MKLKIKKTLLENEINQKIEEKENERYEVKKNLKLKNHIKK